MDKTILEWGCALPNDELWHVRWGIEKAEQRREYFAIRVRAAPNQREDRKKQMIQIAQKLREGDLIQDALFDDEEWWVDDSALRSNCRFPEEWLRLARILQKLSMVTYELLNMEVARGEAFLYSKVVHHIHNMLHILDGFRPLDVGVKGSFNRVFPMTFRLVRNKGTDHFWSPGWDGE